MPTAFVPLGRLCALTALGLSLFAVKSLPAQSADDLVNSLGMRFVLIPRGSFQMGSLESEPFRDEDEHRHPVQLTQSYYLGVFEVTQKQYERVMGSNPSYFTLNGPGRIKIKAKDTYAYPVESVTWAQAAEFCQRLGEREDEKANKHTYRLPTEAEWEFACRGGTSTPLSFGDDASSFDANFNGVAPFGRGREGPFLRAPWTVGGYKGNAFGLFDMHGNVMEWCGDWYDPEYYKTSPRNDPTGPSEGRERVFRGGGWASTGRACRSAARHKLPPDTASYHVGFRVVLLAAE